LRKSRGGGSACGWVETVAPGKAFWSKSTPLPAEQAYPVIEDAIARYSKERRKGFKQAH